MNISLPDALKVQVDEQIARRGFGTISEYVRELIRKDMERQQLRELVLEGMRGPMLPVDDAFWAEIDEEVRGPART